MESPDMAVVLRILGWVVVGIAAAVMAWALLWDRSGGRRRCPKCWYDMGATGSLRCPECGREAKSERALHRTKRRWWIALIGLIGVPAAYAMWSAPRVRSERVDRTDPNDSIDLVGQDARPGGCARDLEYRDASAMVR
jgi:hypothetical protein